MIRNIAPLPASEIETLEHTTKPFLMMCNMYGNIYKLATWHYRAGLDFNLPFYELVKNTSNRLGFRPQKYKNYEGRCAIWAMRIGRSRVLVYLDRRGWAFQIDRSNYIRLVIARLLSCLK